MGAITATGVILVPEQASLLVGSEILAIGLVTVVAPIVIQVRSWSDRKEVTAVQRFLRFVTSAGLGLAFGVGGALLIAGARAGLFWVAAGDIACLVAVVLNAWVLMVEILR